MRAVFALPLVCASLLPFGASASDEGFLKSIEGNWRGGGTVLRTLGGQTIEVSCKMKSNASSSTFSMNGSCRALVVVSRSFNAEVKVSGRSYSGTYVGVSGKPSSLSGSRNGNTINLDVTWANEIYGDRKATMTIEKIGQDGLQIRTIDNDPTSGKSVVTTQLDLKRI